MAKLAWDPVVAYSDGIPLENPGAVAYKIYWKTPTEGYNSADVKDAGNATELDLSFLPPNRYNLAATTLYAGMESVRSIDLPFSNVPPASPSGLRIL